MTEGERERGVCAGCEAGHSLGKSDQSGRDQQEPLGKQTRTHNIF